jgi:hypothetical protein
MNIKDKVLSKATQDFMEAISEIEYSEKDASEALKVIKDSLFEGFGDPTGAAIPVLEKMVLGSIDPNCNTRIAWDLLPKFLDIASKDNSLDSTETTLAKLLSRTIREINRYNRYY